MRISSTTGELEIGQPEIRIGPSLTKDAFVESRLGQTCKRGVTNQEYATYSLSLKDAQNEFGLSLVFREQRLFMISIEMLSAKQSWANWSEEEELRRRVAHDHLLAASLGKPPYRYRWGEVLSLYDPRSGVSSIAIRYALSR